MADAYYLENTAKNGVRVALDNPITIGANVGDFIEFDAVGYAGNDRGRYYIADNGKDDFRDEITILDTSIIVRCDSSRLDFNQNYIQPNVNQRFKVRIERTNTDVWRAAVNDSPIGTLTETKNLLLQSFFGLSSASSRTFLGAYYKVTASTNGGTVTNRWNPSASNGTGLVLIDEVGGNDGTLTGSWPNDNSQWILYDDGVGGGTITADLSLSISKPTFAVSSNVTAPTNSASITFTNSKPAFSILADSIAPSSVANVSFEIDKPSFAVTATSAQPSITTSVSFSLSAPQFSASGMTYISDKPISTPTKRIDGFAAKSLRIDGKKTPLRIDGNIH